MDKHTSSIASPGLGLPGAVRPLCARAAALAAALLLALCVDGAVYQAFSGEPVAWETFLRRAPGWVCAPLRACSA